MSRILVVDDESLMREFLAESLSSQKYEVDSAENGIKALELMKNNKYDLILTDLKMPKITGMEVLSDAREKMPDCKVIMMTAYGTVENAVEAMKIGAFDYITKPFSVDEVLILVKRALEFSSLQKENKRLRSELEDKFSYRSIVGESSVMKKVFETIKTVSQSRSTVLVTGPSGTGKELVAMAIHYSSPRKNGPFIKINCAALPSELMESELFGHEKGAFTGAIRRYHGRFERADGGTLLLDEISEMSPRLQAKLLRVLQEREFEPVGSSETVSVDVRIIATSNRDLSRQIENGDFREDLYYRLSVININLAPLKQRISDIPLLVGYFLEKYNRENGKAVESVSGEVMDLWMNHDWPGNVREFENTIERAVVMCKGKEITISDAEMPFHRSVREPAASAAENSIPGGFAMKAGTSIADMEKDLIYRTLESQNGNRTSASEILGISVRTLRNKLAEYGTKDAFK